MGDRPVGIESLSDDNTLGSANVFAEFGLAASYAGARAVRPRRSRAALPPCGINSRINSQRVWTAEPLIGLRALNQCPHLVSAVQYSAGAQMVAMREMTSTASTLYFLHTDHLGSTSLTTDGSGNVVARQSYYPYGSVRSSQGTLPTRRTFTGQYTEEPNGLGSLMFFNARFFSPLLGRFVSADTMIPKPDDPQMFNRYSYVINNPLRHTDPSGHRCKDGDENADGKCSYYPLPTNTRVIRTRSGIYVDIQHTQKTSLMSQIRTATELRDGGIAVFQGELDGKLFKIQYHIAEGLDDDKIEGVAHGIMLDYQNKFEQAQGKIFPHNIGSSYSPEDLPSDYLGLVQEAKYMELAEIVGLHLGGIDYTLPGPVWDLARLSNFLPKNHTTQPMGLLGNRYDWPNALQIAAPISSSPNTWKPLATEYNSLCGVH